MVWREAGGQTDPVTRPVIRQLFVRPERELAAALIDGRPASSCRQSPRRHWSAADALRPRPPPGQRQSHLACLSPTPVVPSTATFIPPRIRPSAAHLQLETSIKLRRGGTNVLRTEAARLRRIRPAGRVRRPSDAASPDDRARRSPALSAHSIFTCVDISSCVIRAG